MRSNIDDFLHTSYQDDPWAEFTESPNASLATAHGADVITRENKSLAVDNEIRSWLSDTPSDWTLLRSSLSDTLSDWTLLRSWLSDASLDLYLDLYQEYLYREYLYREYESHQQTIEVRLNEVRREAEEVYTYEIDQIPKTAYDDALVLLEEIFRAGISTQNLVGLKMAA